MVNTSQSDTLSEEETQTAVAQFALYPTPKQELLLRAWQEICRKLYNHLLGQVWDTLKKSNLPEALSWKQAVALVSQEDATEATLEERARKKLFESYAERRTTIRQGLKTMAGAWMQDRGDPLPKNEDGSAKDVSLFSKFGTEALRASFRTWRETFSCELRHGSKTLTIAAQDVPAHVLDEVRETVQRTWNEYYVGKSKGEPKFKRFHESVSIVLPDRSRYKIYLSEKQDERMATFTMSMFEIDKKPSPLRFRLHREIQADPGRCTIVRSGSRWYASFTCKQPKPKATAPEGSSVGINRGIVHAIADSHGRLVDGHKALARIDALQQFLQRKLSQQKRGSNRYRRTQERLQNLSRRKANIRKDFAHKESHYYATRYRTVFVDDYDIPKMIQEGKIKFEGWSNHFQRHLHAQGWGMFDQCLKYKIAARGGTHKHADTVDLSRECSTCGATDVQFYDLQKHWFTCGSCGYSVDADTNAARNAEKRGKAALAQPEVAKKAKKLYSVKQRKPKEPHAKPTATAATSP